MRNGSLLLLAALLVSLLCGCNVRNDPSGAEWRRYNDIMSARNCC